MKVMTRVSFMEMQRNNLKVSKFGFVFYLINLALGKHVNKDGKE